MFSFFKSSKKSPTAETPKADDNVQRGADDFELLGGGAGNPMPLYPSAQLPAPPVPATTPHHNQFNRQYSVQYPSYTQNVPFKLNPILSSGPTDEFFEYKLREITQLINNAANTKDYDFKLERSIVEQN